MSVISPLLTFLPSSVIGFHADVSSFVFSIPASSIVTITSTVSSEPDTAIVFSSIAICSETDSCFVSSLSGNLSLFVLAIFIYLLFLIKLHQNSFRYQLFCNLRYVFLLFFQVLESRIRHAEQLILNRPLLLILRKVLSLLPAGIVRHQL